MRFEQAVYVKAILQRIFDAKTAYLRTNFKEMRAYIDLTEGS